MWHLVLDRGVSLLLLWMFRSRNNNISNPNPNLSYKLLSFRLVESLTTKRRYKKFPDTHDMNVLSQFFAVSATHTICWLSRKGLRGRAKQQSLQYCHSVAIIKYAGIQMQWGCEYFAVSTSLN